jgi:osmotically-inducible protein OsmY
LYKRATPATVDDAQLRANVVAQLEAQPWTHPSLLNVIVHDGTVELWGIVDSAAEKRAVRVAAEVTPGVKSVTDNLQVRPSESYA